MKWKDYLFCAKACLIAVSLIFISACAGTQLADVRKSIGQEYHVLKFPVMQHNIGSEWSKQFNATGKGMLTEDKIRVEKSLKRMDSGTANQIALGVAALTPAGLGGGAGIEADVFKQINLHGLQVVKPVALGYIPFKPGFNYVTEALRLEGFAIDSENRLKFEVSATGSVASNGATANLGAGTAANSGYGGEGLVIGYLVQTVDRKTYSKQEFGPVELPLNGKKVPVGKANISAMASYEKVVAGSGKSLPKNLLWACRKAASKKDTINAAWVVTLNMTGDDKKTLKIAFPAHPEIEDCGEYESVVSTGINSITDQIERTVARITIDKASINEMLDPADFNASVSAAKESFNVITVSPEQ